ncbi:hypothetical protein FOL47_005791 [Perkinsus chesapeaki]|uniref:Uncharacterized protein n=1 Tax=Perkinsus chesapeaki TaxID=330153 RepID=A0A7J6MYD3_PERCH|nr:hypothetical protein FOL47_005791 [Perkinsus chesapeaki]
MRFKYGDIGNLIGRYCSTSLILGIASLFTAWLWLIAAHRESWIECSPVNSEAVAYEWGLLPTKQMGEAKPQSVDIRLRVGLQEMSFLVHTESSLNDTFNGEGQQQQQSVGKGKSSIDGYVLRTLSHNCEMWETSNWVLFQSRSEAFVETARAAIGNWSTFPNIHTSPKALLNQAQKGCPHRHRLHVIGNICYIGILTVVVSLMVTAIGLLYISVQKIHVIGVFIASATAFAFSIAVCVIYTIYFTRSLYEGLCPTLGSIDTLESLSRRHYSLAQISSWQPRRLGYCFVLAWMASCLTFLITLVAYRRVNKKMVKRNDRDVSETGVPVKDPSLERLLPL